ncbi:sirohydrochlorin chelatase [Umezawaea endophytica]|uniref:Sirohydrochlorin chelatase n=1 Tax=Umezawaea endophytica TaxID=1654476 RepID=A0A9X3ADP5_9PSEU|nr:sirohydrochlorin chelatase [Umezawaea endophytica]MCS7476327.1 sirohydrochlorin chelatase [Umezawaea endophytica]
MTPLIAVAHGSRDPRSAATVTALLDVVRALNPAVDVRAAFLDLSAPRLGDVLRTVHGEGHRHAVVVPLLLGKAFHARVDVPGAVADVQRQFPRLSVTIGDVLGPDPWLESAALRRLAEAGVRPFDRTTGIVLAGAGSSHAPANAAVAAIAARWAARSGWAGVEPAFASAGDPDVPTAIARLRARGATRVAVASWFLAPGLLPDRITARTLELAPDARIAAPLGADPEVAELVLHRYSTALTGSEVRQYA